MSSSLLSTALAAELEPYSLTVSFALQARPEPGVMPRVLELFAKRGLVPQKWHSTASATALTIDVQMGGLDRDVADYMARCMRQITGVETVLSVETHSGG